MDDQLKQFEIVWRLGGIEAVKKWVRGLSSFNLPVQCMGCSRHIRRAKDPIYALTLDGISVYCWTCYLVVKGSHVCTPLTYAFLKSIHDSRSYSKVLK